MSTSNGDPMALAIEAVRVAEEGLVEVPRTVPVRELQRRIAALKSVFRGDAWAILTREQQRRATDEAMHLVCESMTYCRRAAG